MSLNPNLMSTFTPRSRELYRIGGAMLFMINEVLLRGGQSFLDRCIVGGHQNPRWTQTLSLPPAQGEECIEYHPVDL
jgi:hypothetical protein